MADSKETMNLTPRQTELARAMVQCMKSKPDIDYHKFLAITKLGNIASARRQVDRILELLGAGAAKGKDNTTPKKKATPPKKRKQVTNDEDDDSEEPAAKKAATEDGDGPEASSEKVKDEDNFFD